MKRHRCASLVLCLVMASTVFACHGRTASGPPPNVLLIVVDTLRADRLGVYGNSRGLTPFLDQLAGRGTVFTNAYAPTSWTAPSVASLFTSRYSRQHGVIALESKLADAETTLAEALAPLHYVAGGFSANFRVDEAHGFAQGFAHWRVFLPDPDAKKVRGDVVRRESTKWFDTTRKQSPGRPILLYLHYMESHAPYEPVEPFRSRFQRLDVAAVDPDAAKAKLLRWVGTGTRKLSPAEIDHLESLYDGEAASVDAEIRLLVSELDALGFFANAVVVFTADHGEEFAEHGEVLHGRTLYNAAIKIPLIIVAPGFAGGHVVDENVSLLDVAPTVQDLAGALPQANAEGHSLRRLMKPAFGLAGAAPSEAPAPVLCELEPESKHHTRAHTDAIIERSYKLLLRPDGETELFDLSRDPGEQHPLSPTASQPSAAELLGALETRQAELRLRANVSRETQPVDEATREKLRALGYQF